MADIILKNGAQKHERYQENTCGHLQSADNWKTFALHTNCFRRYHASYSCCKRLETTFYEILRTVHKRLPHAVFRDWRRRWTLRRLRRRVGPTPRTLFRSFFESQTPPSSPFLAPQVRTLTSNLTVYPTSV